MDQRTTRRRFRASRSRSKPTKHPRSLFKFGDLADTDRRGQTLPLAVIRATGYRHTNQTASP